MMQTHAVTLPETGLVRLPQILAVFPISKSGWWAGVKTGKYPASVKHGRCTFWRAEDIHMLLVQIAAKSPEKPHDLADHHVN
jgi:prophage regulatory protein